MIHVAISGGVDSLAALLLMRESGKPVSAWHAIMHPSRNLKQKLEHLSRICAKLEVPFKILDLQKEFHDHVLGPMLSDYAVGETPNPCIWCNKNIKFGVLKGRLLADKDDIYVTGHYANLVPNPYGREDAPILAPALDENKNQTYFLSFLNPEQLKHLLFPLATWQKKDVKKFVAESGLKPADQEESQDLCFDRKAFFKKNCEASKTGPVYLQDSQKGLLKLVGYHNGLENYTIGQRKGLGFSAAEPLYVTGKDSRNNALFVAKLEDALIRKTVCAMVSMFVPPKLWPEKIFARLRYRSKLLNVEKASIANDAITLYFDDPVFPGAPGQAAVIYDASERILAAGVITQ